MTRRRLTQRLPTLVAAGILVILITIGGLRFTGFVAPQNLLNLLSDYAFLGIAAVGATFVIISGGIDLSVGSTIAFTSVLTTILVADHGWHPLAAGGFCLVLGTLIGALMGWLIRAFELPAFLVTLAGMFAIRAAGFLLSGESTPLAHPFLSHKSRWALSLGPDISIPLRSLVFLSVVMVGAMMINSSRFGMNVRAVGGQLRAATAMGVPVGRTIVTVYALAGFCSSFAGLVFVFAKLAGDPTSVNGLELSVIASVVIGGTLLSGGVGSMVGTLLGVLILGTIRLLIDFEGNLDSSWTSIAIGLLLLLFVSLQLLLSKLGSGAVEATGDQKVGKT